MKILEQFESKKANKLIFRQRTSDLPSLGSIVAVERNSPQKSHSKEKKYSDIGKIIDIFGPVKEPWVVVNLFKSSEMDFNNTVFYWKKEVQFKKKFSKGDKNKPKKFGKFENKEFKKKY
jgi:rRNA processing protein Gar1